MAREVRVHLIDDLSGDEAQEAVKFGIDGVDHEIDLTTEHAAELRKQLAQYIAHARRTKGSPGSRNPRTVTAGRDEAHRMREWALEHGYTPSSRGRISQDIRRAYGAAHA